MLKAVILYIAVLAHATILPAVRADDDVVFSRKSMLRLIDGTTTENRLYLERCMQSSLQESCVFALDEDINQESWSNECAITTADMNPYWEARLENPAFITRVQIFGLKNIGERGFDALTNFQLLVGDHICINYLSYSSFENKTFACDYFADSIRIQSSRPHSVLALCEVVVYGKYVKLHRTETRPAVKSCLISGNSGGNCHKALDGNLEQLPADSVCAQSGKERAPWFEAKLQFPSIIRRVVVHNRGDSLQDQLNSFEVSVNGQLCFKYDRDTSFSKEEFFCGRFGSRVRLQITRPKEENSLTLCEFEMFGYQTAIFYQAGYEYLGCYREKKQDRDISKMVAIDNMSREKCERMCRRQKKPFFGLQQGKQCWCSERYGMYGRLAENACWMRCDGNTKHSCGAKLVNNVFKIN